MEEIVVNIVSTASAGLVVGFVLGGIVIIIDYVITTSFSMFKGR